MLPEDERARIDLSGTADARRLDARPALQRHPERQAARLLPQHLPRRRRQRADHRHDPDGATDARRAFPCWDEPEFKAVFSVTLVVDEGLMAVSNGRRSPRRARGNGKKAVKFADTIKMSTYLVALRSSGKLEATEPVDVDGTPLRIVFVPGKRHLADFALEAGAFSLRFFADYYGIPYPGDKLDMIALPDFASGAMENLGAVTYRETALLVDTSTAFRADLERVADVVAHEIAHMWFGDLVTMRWWNGIWLNEAFATFMEMLAVDALKPEWERWNSFSVARPRRCHRRAAQHPPDRVHRPAPEEARACSTS